MSEEQDGFMLNAFGVDLGQLAQNTVEEGSAMLGQAANTVSQVVHGVQGAVEGAIGEVTGAVSGAVKKVAGAVSGSPGGQASGGGTGSFPLGGSVGRGGRNATNDVRAAQTALGIAADGQCGGQTIAAIEAFQRSIGQARPDGRVDAGGATERALAGGAKPAATPPASPEADGGGGLLGQLREGAAGLIDDAKGLGNQLIEGAEGLLDDAKQLGGELLDGAKKAADGVLDNPGALLNDASGASSGLALTGKFHHELPETKFAEFPATSYLKGSLKYKSEITAEIVKGGKGGSAKLTGTTNQGAKVEIDLAKQKADDFSNETLRGILKTLKIKELKESLGCEVSGARINIDFSVTAILGSDSVDWINGVAKGKFVLLSAAWADLAKNPNDFTFAGAGIEGGARGHDVISMDAIGIPGFGLDVVVTGVVSGTVSFNFARILLDASEKAAAQGAKEASKQLVKGSELAAIEVIIGVGLVLVAIAVVVGTAQSLAVAGEERALVGQVLFARNQFEAGLFKALAGEPKPGGGFLGKGWEAGNRVFQEALKQAEKRFAGALPDEIRQQAINSCLTVTKNAEIQPKITRTIGELYWKSWIAGNHGVTTFLGQAKTACGICFSRGPIASNDPDLQAWRDASDLPDALK